MWQSVDAVEGPVVGAQGLADAVEPRAQGGSRARLGALAGGDRWVLPAAVGLGMLAAVVYLWDLTVSGYANTYYSAAALAASQSWSAWFFGSFDAANFITVDKPPLSTMVMGLSVRLFGLSSWSILLPQALAGVASVLLVLVLVRRSFGSVAGLIAGLVMALTPVAALMFRYNNPDALLTLLLLLATWALLRALEKTNLPWVALSALFVGLAFNTKYLQAFLVLPVFALVYLVAAHGGLRRRIAGLLVAAATIVVSSFWWVAIVDLLPASARPYVGGSTNNTALDLVLGYDGLGRIFGATRPDGSGGQVASGPGAGFGGDPGLLRMSNEQFGGQIGWLIPLAMIGLVVGLWVYRRAGRSEPALTGYLLWGGWLAIHLLVFSLMSGIIHPYYTVALAPAVAALVGGGLVEMWRLRERTWYGGLLLGGSIVLTAAWGAVLLARTPGFVPGLGTTAVVLAVVAAVLVALPRRVVPVRLAALATGLGLAAGLLGPAAYTAATVDSAIAGGDPTAGPATASTRFGPVSVPLAPTGSGSGTDGITGELPELPGDAGLLDGPGTPVWATTGGDGGGMSPGTGGAGVETVDQALVDYLVANRGDATWVIATTSAMAAGSIQLATGMPVMAMGGFSGTDPAPTLEQLKDSIALGELRFVIAGSGGPGGRPGGPGGIPSGFPGNLPGGMPGGPPGASSAGDGAAPGPSSGTGLPPGAGSMEATASERDAWVTSACTEVPLDDASNASSSAGFAREAGPLYDCAGAGTTE